MADKPGPVLVTGANSGIGLATTLLLARRGWETWGTVRSQGQGDGAARRRGGRRGRRSRAPGRARRLRRQGRRATVVRSCPTSTPSSTTPATPSSARSRRCRPKAGPRAARRQRHRAGGRVVVRPAGDARAGRRAHRDGVVDVRPGGDHAAERLVPRLEVRPRGAVGRAAHGGRRLRRQGRDRRTRLLQDRHRDRPASRADARVPPRTRRTARRTERATTGLEPSNDWRRRPTPWPTSSLSAIASGRPLRRYLVGADALTLASTHPLIPRAFTDAATRLVTGLGGGPRTFT